MNNTGSKIASEVSTVAGQVQIALRKSIESTTIGVNARLSDVLATWCPQLEPTRFGATEIATEDPFVLSLRRLGEMEAEATTDEARQRLTTFRYLVNMMVRWRVLLFGYLTATSSLRGLRIFREYFGQMRSLRRHFLPTLELRDRVASLSDESEPLAHLEFRIDAPQSADALDALVEQYGRWMGWPSNRRESLTSLRDLADPSCRPTVCFSIGLEKPSSDMHAEAVLPRFSDIANRYRSLIDVYAEYYERHPEILHLVRGLDVFNDERAVPNWVPCLSYRYFNERLKPGMVSPGYHHTFHAGEDYRTATEGLRAIHEAVTGCKMSRGDRVGHGLALGGRVPDSSVRNTLGVWMEDLAWEWGMWDSEGNAPLCLQVEADWRRVSSALEQTLRGTFGSASVMQSRVVVEASMNDLWLAYRLRHRFEDMEDLGLVSSRPGRAWLSRESVNELRDGLRRHQILYDYLCNPELHVAFGNVFELPVDVSRRDRTKLLVDRVTSSCRDIAIEVCPTSNLVIGDFDEMSDHPVLSICPPTGEHLLSAVVCSDDPLLFNNRVRHEYLHLFHAAVTKGTSTRAATSWLTDLHQHGLERRFSFSQNVQEVRSLHQKLFSISAPRSMH